MRIRRGIAIVAMAGVTAFGAAGCGDDKKATADIKFETTGKISVPTDLSKKPTVPKLQGLPPEKLTTQDVVVGKGAAVKPGDKIQVEYVGVSHSTDTQFDTSWGKQPFDTTLKKGNVIDGWVKGLTGMKVGGRRVLMIPPDLGYGANGSPPSIAPYETLVFVVDLKKVG
jgi:FKBP-type peptidyl-prolyl cis-trans isomerase